MEARAERRVTAAEVQSAVALARRVATNVSQAAEVRDSVIEQLIVAVLAGGHVLIEDLPGVGKTTLARALARSLELEFARIQCTADLLPSPWQEASHLNPIFFLINAVRFGFLGTSDVPIAIALAVTAARAAGGSAGGELGDGVEMPRSLDE